jgi:hypothetical protein
MGHRAVCPIAPVGEFASFENEAMLGDCVWADETGASGVILIDALIA